MSSVIRQETKEKKVQRPRVLAVELTGAARRALDARGGSLVVEMELFFSCLVRKRLRFLPRAPTGASVLPCEAHERLQTWFHPVVSQHCALPAEGDLESLPLMDFPLVRREAFSPRWLKLDYRGGVFQGDFGW